MQDDERPTLDYRPVRPADEPVGGGPVGCALMAMLTFAFVCLAMFLAAIVPLGATLATPALRRLRFATVLATGVVTLAVLGWAAVRLGLDRRSRPFGHGIWIGTLLAALVIALVLLGDFR